MRYVTDRSWRRFGQTVLAGSPLRLFRLTGKGESVAAEIEMAGAAEPSGLTDSLLDAGAIHPSPATLATTGSAKSKRLTPADVTVVTPQLGGTVHGDGRITVDDGSDPPLKGAAVRLTPNRGPAAARNAARPQVSTPLVAFVDADVDIDGNSWLEPLLAHFDDPRVGLVAPRVRGEHGSPLDMGDRAARIAAGTRVSYVPAAAIVVRVTALDAIGGFDEGLRYGEDVDFVWRLNEASWRCRYEPSGTVWHQPRSTWRERLRQHAGYGTSAAPLALRHPGALAPVRVNKWTAIAWTLLLLGHPIVAFGTATASACALVRQLNGVPPRSAWMVAARGHVLAGQQIASAMRRVWWPIVAVVALFSRRMRWIAAGAILSNIRATPTDAAYGWGVWSGARLHRCWEPLIPALGPWPSSSTQRLSR